MACLNMSVLKIRQWFTFLGHPVYVTSYLADAEFRSYDVHVDGERLRF